VTVSWWPFKRRPAPVPEREPERPRCTDGYCRAWSWDLCCGGRCKWHCDVYCKCVPVGKPGALTVVKGG